MTLRLKTLLIALAVLGTVAIVVNVYSSFSRSKKKTVTAIDMATGEVKKLSVEEAKAIRDGIMQKIGEQRRGGQEEQLEAERKGERRE